MCVGQCRMRQVGAGVGPTRLVDDRPVDEDLVVALAQVPGHRSLVDVIAEITPAGELIGAADGYCFAVVFLEGDAPVGGLDGLVIGSRTYVDRVAPGRAVG